MDGKHEVVRTLLQFDADVNSKNKVRYQMMMMLIIIRVLSIMMMIIVINDEDRDDCR